MPGSETASGKELDKIQAVILAGGLGTRLRPLTHSFPKPMAPVKGKPYLFYQVQYLKSCGIKDILLLVSYKSEKIIDYFGNGNGFGASINYSVEDSPLGTGGALKKAEPLIKDVFFLINGDSFIPLNLRDVYIVFSREKKNGLLAVYNNRVDTLVENNIALDGESLVIKYQKKSQDKSLKYVDAGLAVYRRDILELMEPGKVISLENEIFPVLIKQKQLYGYKTNQRFFDIGTPERLKIFEEALDDYFPHTVSS